MTHYHLCFSLSDNEWHCFHKDRELSNSECNRLFSVLRRRFFADTTEYHHRFAAYELAFQLLKLSLGSSLIYVIDTLEEIEFDNNFNVCMLFRR